MTTGKISDGAILPRHLAAETAAIGPEEISENAVWSKHVALDNLQAEDIDTGAVTTEEIQNGTILSEDIADGAVTTAKIADGAVTTAKIADGAVTGAKVATEAITGLEHIENLSVLSEDIATEAITGLEHIENNTVENEDISTGFMQSNYVEVDNSGGPIGHVDASITFSPAFPACPIVTATDNDNSVCLGVTDITTEGCTISAEAPDASTYLLLCENIRWIAMLPKIG